MMVSKQSLLKDFWPSHVPNFGELGAKVGPSLLGRTVCFQLQLEREVLGLTNPSYCVGVENGSSRTLRVKF